MDRIHYRGIKYRNWSEILNPRMFALNCLCQLAVEAKAGKQYGWDFWHNYWTERYIKTKRIIGD